MSHKHEYDGPNSEKRPYPWPVRPILLKILRLPRDTSEEEYEAYWRKHIAPLADMTDEEFKQHLIDEIVRDFDLSPVGAEKMFGEHYPKLQKSLKNRDLQKKTFFAANSKSAVSAADYEQDAVNSKYGNAFHQKWKSAYSMQAAQAAQAAATKSAQEARAEYMEAVNDMMELHQLTRERAQNRLLNTEKGRRLWDEWQAAASNATTGESQKK